jgi:hypothetical protein
MRTDQIVAPPNQNVERVVVRVGTSTYFVFGILSALPLITGVEFLRQHQILGGIACVLAAVAFFSFYTFQSIVFDGGTMFVRRSLFPDQPIPVSEISNVLVELRSRNGRPFWEGAFSNGATVLGKFNPKLYSFEALDTIFEQIRCQSPNVIIIDGTHGLRRKTKT